MKKYYRWIAGLLCLALTGCSAAGSNTASSTAASGSVSTASDADMSFKDFTLDLFKETVSQSYLYLHTSVKNPETYGITMDEISLGDIDLSTLEEDYAEFDETLEALNNYNYDALSDEDKVTYDILKDYMDRQVAAKSLSPYFSEPLNTTSGNHSGIPTIMSEYDFYTTSDVDDYLVLLDDVDDYFDDIIQFEQDKSKEGFFMSDVNADIVIEQCKDFIENPDDNVLIEVFPEKLNDLSDLSDSDRASYIEKNDKLVKDVVIPSYEKLITALTDLKGTGKNSGGLSNYDQGKDYFKYLLSTMVGTDKTPETLIKMSQASIDEALTTMAAIYSTNPNIYTEMSSATPVQTVPEDILKHLTSAITSDFPEPMSTSYTVKSVKKALEDSTSPAFYMIPKVDETDKNTIYINSSKLSDTLDLFSTLTHEGYPGHAYQYSYFNSTNPAEIRSVIDYTGYSEGWAVYAEMYGYHYAGLSEDVADFLEAYDQLLYGIYGRLDLGINYESWTIDDVSNYLLSYLNVEEADVEDIYYRITSYPANYLNYAAGYLEFKEMRQKAEDALDDQFDLKKFHEFLLKFGPASYNVLNMYLDKWLQS